MLATITAALMMFYASATAQAKDMVRRIHDATIALVSLDRQMIGRLAYVVVPDFMYLEYRALYLELRPFRDFHGRVPPIVRAPVVSGAAVAGRPPYPAARRDASPHHAAVTSAAAPVVVARSRGRRGSGLKGSRTERMVEQLAEFKAWLRDNPVNERIAARTVGARASIRKGCDADGRETRLQQSENSCLRLPEQQGVVFFRAHTRFPSQKTNQLSAFPSGSNL